jgi:hypothetical protein
LAKEPFCPLPFFAKTLDWQAISAKIEFTLSVRNACFSLS